LALLWIVNFHGRVILKICAANSVLCFLIRPIRQTVNSQVLLLIYYGEYYSQVTFSILFWGPKPNAHVILKIQKRGLRLMCNASPSAPRRPFIKKLVILPLPCIYIFTAIVWAKKNICNYASNDNYYSYDTRNSKNLHQVYVRTKILNMPQSILVFYYITNFLWESKVLKSYLYLNVNCVYFFLTYYSII
jgi:hypothetical protein